MRARPSSAYCSSRSATCSGLRRPLAASPFTYCLMDISSGLSPSSLDCMGSHRGVMKFCTLSNQRIGPARFGIPLEIEGSPVEPGEKRKDLGDGRPTREQVGQIDAGYLGKGLAQNRLEPAVGQGRIISQPAPEQEARSHLVNHLLGAVTRARCSQNRAPSNFRPAPCRNPAIFVTSGRFVR